MNDIIFVNTMETEIKNPALRSATKKLYTKLSGARKNMLEACAILADIKSKALYEKEGFAKFGDYTEKFLGISQAKASRMINIANRFVTTENENLRLADKDYSECQLAELLPINDEQVMNVIADGEITAESKIKDIRKVVKAIKNGLEIIDITDDFEDEPHNPENDTADETPEPEMKSETIMREFDSYSDFAKFIMDNKTLRATKIRAVFEEIKED